MTVSIDLPPEWQIVTEPNVTPGSAVALANPGDDLVTWTIDGQNVTFPLSGVAVDKPLIGTLAPLEITAGTDIQQTVLVSFSKQLRDDPNASLTNENSWDLGTSFVTGTLSDDNDQQTVVTLLEWFGIDY